MDVNKRLAFDDLASVRTITWHSWRGIFWDENGRRTDTRAVVPMTIDRVVVVNNIQVGRCNQGDCQSIHLNMKEKYSKPRQKREIRRIMGMSGVTIPI